MGSYNLASEIRGIIDGLERDNPDLSATERVKRAWNRCIDQRIRDHVTAVFVVPNTAASEVVVYVDDSIWATELNMKVELLRLDLNVELQKSATATERRGEQVESLKFKVSSNAYIAKKNRQSDFDRFEEEERNYQNIQPIALSDEEMSSIQEAASMMENDNLRDIAYAAAKASLEWQKGLERLSS